MKKERGARMKRVRKREEVIGSRRVCVRKGEIERVVGKKRVWECGRETERRRERI